MPNWVATKLRFVDVTDEEFRNIVDQYCTKEPDGDTTLDFQKLIPMPDTVFRGPLSAEDREKYPGELNWYDWSVNHWGTKWNACHGSVNYQRHEIRYDTAWSFAEPPVWALVENTKAQIDVTAMNEDIACGAKWHAFWFEDDMVCSDSDDYAYGTPEFWETAADLWGIYEDEMCDDDEEEEGE